MFGDGGSSCSHHASLSEVFVDFLQAGSQGDLNNKAQDISNLLPSQSWHMLMLQTLQMHSRGIGVELSLFFMIAPLLVLKHYWTAVAAGAKKFFLGGCKQTESTGDLVQAPWSFSFFIRTPCEGYFCKDKTECSFIWRYCVRFHIN